MAVLDQHKIKITCGKCSRKTSKTIGWLKAHNSFTCACGDDVPIDRASLEKEIASFEKSVGDINKMLSDFKG